MKLLCQTPIPGGSDWQYIIAAKCGPYCHTEIQLADGRSFSAQYKEGVRFLSAEQIGEELSLHANFWRVIDLPWKETPQTLKWCESLAGAKYDYVGALMSGFGLAWRNAVEWFCSETSAEVISRDGGLVVPGLLCPTHLVGWIDGLLAGKSPTQLARSLLAKCEVAAPLRAWSFLEKIIDGGAAAKVQ